MFLRSIPIYCSTRSAPVYNVSYTDTMVMGDSLTRKDKYYIPIWWWFPVFSCSGHPTYNVTFVDTLTMTHLLGSYGALTPFNDNFRITESFVGETSVVGNLTPFDQEIEIMDVWAANVEGDYGYADSFTIVDRFYAWHRNPSVPGSPIPDSGSNGTVDTSDRVTLDMQNTSSGAGGETIETPMEASYVSNFIMSYADLEIQLPPPILGDTLSQQITRVDELSRGLTRHLYKDGNWYDTRIYEYTFTNVTAAQKDDFLELVRAAGADFVTVLDYLERQHAMLIVEIQEVEEVRDDECSYTIGLSLQEIL